MNQIKFVVCSQQQYDNLNTPNAGTFYYVVYDPSDPNGQENQGKGKLYIGTNLIGDGITIDDVITYLEDETHVHTFPGITAGDITPKSDAPIDMSSYFDIQTTGGDNDLKTGTGALRKIKGNLYDSSTEKTSAGGLTTGNLTPFYATTYTCTQMNLLNKDSKIGNAYVFPVTTGEAGQYKTTQGNNGYVWVGVQPSSVYFVSGATKPTTMPSSGAITPQVVPGTSNAKYYLPSGKGWLVVSYSGTVTETTDQGVTTFSINGTEIGIHVAWSNYNDDVAGTSKNSSLTISSYIEAVHSWGLAGIANVTRSVSDEVDLDAGYAYGLVNRIALNAMSWTAVTGETNQYSAELLDMVADGLWACKSEDSVFTSLSLDGNTFTITLAEGKDTSDLTATMWLYYEMANQTQTAISVSSNEVDANDFGLTYFSNGNNLTVPVKAFVEESFQQSGKDQIFNNITYVRTMAEVVATALCELDSRLKPIEDGIENGFEYLKITDLDVTNLNVTGEFNLLAWIDF